MLEGGIGVNLEIRDRVASMSSREVIEGVIDGPKSSQRLSNPQVDPTLGGPVGEIKSGFSRS